MNPMYRRAMCDWIAECDQFEYEEDEQEAREGLCDKDLLKWINRYYTGGVSRFLADLLVSPVLVAALDAMPYARRREYIQRVTLRMELCGGTRLDDFITALNRHFVTA